MLGAAAGCIGVVGVGQMGAGIAQVCAQAGYSVLLYDTRQHLRVQTVAQIAQSVQRLLNKQQLTEPLAHIMQRLHWVDALTELSACTWLIEAITEDITAKQALFAELSALMSADSYLASNTSSISITTLARASRYPERCIGVHFMNPVPVMPAVELILGQCTSAATEQAALAWIRALGKTPIVAQDYPGFIANRILMPTINEAIFCLMEGVGTAEAIDQMMTLGLKHPMGALRLADLIGLDTCLSILELLHQQLGDKYRPCPLLRRMVAAGHLGRKTGIGFYSYPVL